MSSGIKEIKIFSNLTPILQDYLSNVKEINKKCFQSVKSLFIDKVQQEQFEALIYPHLNSIEKQKNDALFTEIILYEKFLYDKLIEFIAITRAIESENFMNELNEKLMALYVNDQFSVYESMNKILMSEMRVLFEILDKTINKLQIDIANTEIEISRLKTEIDLISNEIYEARTNLDIIQRSLYRLCRQFVGDQKIKVRVGGDDLTFIESEIISGLESHFEGIYGERGLAVENTLVEERREIDKMVRYKWKELAGSVDITEAQENDMTIAVDQLHSRVINVKSQQSEKNAEYDSYIEKIISLSQKRDIKLAVLAYEEKILDSKEMTLDSCLDLKSQCNSLITTNGVTQETISSIGRSIELVGAPISTQHLEYFINEHQEKLMSNVMNIISGVSLNKKPIEKIEIKNEAPVTNKNDESEIGQENKPITENIMKSVDGIKKKRVLVASMPARVQASPSAPAYVSSNSVINQGLFGRQNKHPPHANEGGEASNTPPLPKATS